MVGPDDGSARQEGGRPGARFGETSASVADAITAWISYRRKLVDLALVAQSTFDNQTPIAAKLRDELGAFGITDLRKSHIEIYVGTRRQTCVPMTVRGEINVLRQILNWCIDEQLLTAKPRFPMLAVPNTEAALPSDEAFLWVLANVPANHAAALEFMMLTGLSPHELERLQVQDVAQLGDTHPDSVGIGQRPDFPVKQPSRRRFVALNGRARDIWFQEAAGRAAASPVFPRVEAMQKAMRRSVTAAPSWATTAIPAGARGITPKLMRKWFASEVAKGGAPEHVLQRLLGHAPGSPMTRRHYVRSTDDQVTAAAAGLRIGAAEASAQ